MDGAKSDASGDLDIARGYRTRGAELRVLAESFVNPQTRQRLLTLADHCMEMAEAVERRHRQQLALLMLRQLFARNASIEPTGTAARDIRRGVEG